MNKENPEPFGAENGWLLLSAQIKKRFIDDCARHHGGSNSDNTLANLFALQWQIRHTEVGYFMPDVVNTPYKDGVFC